MKKIFFRDSVVSNKLKIISVKNFCNPNFFLRKQLNSILEKNYEKYYDVVRLGYNYPIIDGRCEFFHNLKRKYLEIVIKKFGFFNLVKCANDYCWCYRSHGSHYSSLYHNHIKTSTINAVYYYQINKGDSINFLGNDRSEFTYFPEQNEIIIFPNYLIHKPNKPFGNKIRYSINMELCTLESANQLFSFI